MKSEESFHSDVKSVVKKPRRRLKDVDLSKISQKMANILEREINLLFDESLFASLSETSHKKFLSYLKLLPELQDAELEAFNSMSDEELAKRLNLNSKKEPKDEQSD